MFDPNNRGPIRYSALVILLVAAGVMGCRENKPVAAPQTARIPAVEKFDPKAREAEIKIKQELRYVGIGKRNPFQSIIEATKAELARKKQAGQLSPLQRHDISAFKLIAIVESKAGNVAMLITPDGKAFTVSQGMPLGREGGAITQILGDRVRVEEKTIDYRGEVLVRTRTLELPKPQGTENLVLPE